MLKPPQVFSNQFSTFHNVVPNFQCHSSAVSGVGREGMLNEEGRDSGASTLCLYPTFLTKENVETVTFLCLLWEFSKKKISFKIQTA